ncbi:MAG: rolling circle replication-associated protein, partial [Planctomycetota bacterium]
MPDPKPLPEYLVAPWNKKPPAHTIATIGTLWGFLQTCPHAQTLEAYSSQLRCTVWIALPCRQWSCRHCAQKKIRELAVKTERARPNRFLTLTVDPQLYENPRHAFDQTRRKVSECMRTLRNRYGELEYLRVTELTRRGWPHYHMLVRSPYIPHEVVKRRWRELTGAIIVDLRKIKETLN